MVYVLCPFDTSLMGPHLFSLYTFCILIILFHTKVGHFILSCHFIASQCPALVTSIVLNI